MDINQFSFKTPREIIVPGNIPAYQRLKGMDLALKMIRGQLAAFHPSVEMMAKDKSFKRFKKKIESVVTLTGSFLKGKTFLLAFPDNTAINWKFTDMRSRVHNPSLYHENIRITEQINREKLFVLKLLFKLHYLITIELSSRTFRFVLVNLLKTINSFVSVFQGSSGNHMKATALKLINALAGQIENLLTMGLAVDKELIEHINSCWMLPDLSCSTEQENFKQLLGEVIKKVLYGLPVNEEAASD